MSLCEFAQLVKKYSTQLEISHMLNGPKTYTDVGEACEAKCREPNSFVILLLKLYNLYCHFAQTQMHFLTVPRKF